MAPSASKELACRPTLLLGASGFLGPALIDAFGRSEVIATHSTHAGAESVYFDARKTSVADLVSPLHSIPRAAVLLFGITNIDQCARDPAGTAEINVKGTIGVIDELRALGITPLFISSDGVFEGNRAFWKEDDEPRPILQYGRQKLAVERYLSSLLPPWVIVRLPKLLAPGFNSRCMLTGWAAALGKEGKILCATDQFFTPAAAPDAAQAIATLVHEGAQGLFHLGGPERLSRRALLGAFLDEYRKFAAPRAEVVECSLRDVPVFEPRPLDTSLNSDRFAMRFGKRFCDPATVAGMAVRAYFSAKAQ